MPCSLARADNHGSVRPVRELFILAIHLMVTFAKLLRPGGVRALAAESLLLKHQLLITNRSRQRAPNLTTLDRVVLGLTTLFVNPRRIAKLGALIKPATLFKFHKTLVDRKYLLLFCSSYLAKARCKSWLAVRLFKMDCKASRRAVESSGSEEARLPESSGDGWDAEGNNRSAKCGRAASGNPLVIAILWDSLDRPVGCGGRPAITHHFFQPLSRKTIPPSRPAYSNARSR